jgi:hypothetical protein
MLRCRQLLIIRVEPPFMSLASELPLLACAPDGLQHHPPLTGRKNAAST